MSCSSSRRQNDEVDKKVGNLEDSQNHPPIGTEVRVRITIHRIVDIDIPQHTFTASIQLEARWTDSLESSSHLDGDERANLIVLANLVGEVKNKEEWTVAGDEPNSKCYRIKCEGTFQTRFKLRYFPFDMQELSIVVVSPYPDAANFTALPAKRPDDKSMPVTLVRNRDTNFRSVVNRKTFARDDEFNLFSNVIVYRSTTDPECSASRVIYPQLEFKVCIDRKYKFWLINVIIPFFIMSSAITTTFLVDAESSADRVGLVLTILLTMVAFKYAVSDKLPAISYLTIMDKYILLGFGICFVSLIILVLQSPNMCDFGDSPFIKWGAIGFFFLWLLLHLVAMWLYHLRKRENRMNRIYNSTNDSLWIGCSTIVERNVHRTMKLLEKAVKKELEKKSVTVMQFKVWKVCEAKKELENIFTEKLGKQDSKCNITYDGKMPFITIRLSSEKEVDEVLKDYEEEKKNGEAAGGLFSVLHKNDFTLERLEPVFHPLAEKDDNILKEAGSRLMPRSLSSLPFFSQK